MWLIYTFILQTKLGLIYPANKLGFVSYILKPGAPNTQASNLRPVTLLPVFFKILSKHIICGVRYDAEDGPRGVFAYALHLSDEGKSGSGRLPGCEPQTYGSFGG